MHTIPTRRHLIALLALLTANSSFAQFDSFNDHAPASGTTHPNTTIYSADPAQTGGAAGFMTNITSGARLPVTLTVSAGGNVTYEGTQGDPATGTPLYTNFNTFVSFQGTPNPSIAMNGAGATYTYTFTGLDPNKRYSFRGGAVRAGGYTDRWTLCEITGASSFTSAHSGTASGNALTTAQVPAITASQAAFNFGSNDGPTQGDMADWENIDPGPDGAFAVVCSQYLGTVPGGSTAGSKGYAITGVRLQEINTIPVAVAITNQPQDLIVGELQPATFTVGAAGNPRPTYQWYRGTDPITDATNETYTIPSAALGDNNAVFKVVASNTTNGVVNTDTSGNATLTVLADNTAPTLFGAISVAQTSVLITFSEPVTELTATNVSNYAITNPTSTLTISAAVLQSNGSNVVLTTSTQAGNTVYTVTVNGIRDRSAAANQIAPNSRTNFNTAAGYTTANIGNPGTNGALTSVDGGFNLTGGGADIGGASDQFSFAYQQRSGDFDVKVRVQGLTQPDSWTKAGIMVRQSLTANSTFAGAFASPGAGCFFESRATSGGTAALQGYAPINFPSTWLRLQRVGATMTGYASLDGFAWLQLGVATITISDPVFLGYAVSSHTNTILATAQFRDVGAVSGATTVPALNSPIEPAGPSTRRCPIAITEIMYKPRPRNDNLNLEFVEIYNSNPFFEDISNYRLSGEIEYTFPANTIMPGNSYLVIAKAPADVQAVYGINGVLGPYDGSLSSSGTLRLRNQVGHIYLEIPYSNNPPWPVAPDGTGHSLVLARPSYGEAYPQAWAASDSIGGSPGQFDGYTGEALRSVVINEFFANTTNIGAEYIELYNHSLQPVDLSGVWLSDDPATNKFRINNISIPAYGYVTFTEAQLGFSLNANGETIFLVNSNRTRVIDAVKYTDQPQGLSSGRYPDGAAEIYLLNTTSPGTANTGIRIDDIVINEIMYNPISENNDDEYVELYNQGPNTINLNGWSFLAGIDYTFTNNTLLASSNYLVIAKNRTNLLAHYPNLTTANTLGDYNGTLKNGGETLALARPETHIETIITTNQSSQLVTNTVTNTLHIIVDQTTYTSGNGRWGEWSAGGGSSLELTDPRANHRLPSNWADSDETQKATWTTIDIPGTLDNGATQGGQAIDRVEIYLLGDGECLIDDIDVLNNGISVLATTNQNFTAGLGAWVPQGDHVRSTLETTEGYSGTINPGQPGQSLHLRASARGDSGANRLRCALTTALAANNTCTLRAKVRWLKGWPEILLRIEGNYHEAFGRMNLPANLGTPGLPNSRMTANTGPAITDVRHSPVLPAANTPILITARLQDPDGLAAPQLKYRLDPAANYTTTNMLDNGTGGDQIPGDGIYTATIPGQASGAMIAFIIQATDTAAIPLTTTFPPDAYNSQSTPPIGRAPYPGEPATGREALIRVGDPVNSRTDGNTTPATFGIYRYWLTQNSVNTWINRPSLSNERVEGTFVYGNFRAIYNISGKYAGSPYHQGFSSPVANACHYSLDLPKDDLLLGTENFNKLHAPGNGPWDDNTCQREQAGYWLARQLNIPWNYRRSINFIINGTRRNANALMEDSVTPGGDVIDSVFPDDPDGNLYKLQPWFEFDDVNVTAGTGAGFANQRWCSLDNVTTTGGVKKTARYRQNYLARAVKGSANDYQDVFNLVNAMSVAPNPASQSSVNNFVQSIDALVDTEEWLRIFAVEHSVGNWDSFGNRNAQNMYGYKPTNGKWTLMIWDYNIILGNSGSDGPGAQLFQYQSGQDSNMGKFYNINTTGGSPNPWGTWVYRRTYWRALKELAAVHMANPLFFAMLDAKYAAYQANGLTGIANPQAIKDFCNGARPSILQQLAAEDNGTFSPGTNNFLTVTNNLLTINGTAPVDVKTIKINGVQYPLTWTGVSTYTMVVALPTENTTLNFQGYDLNGNPISTATTTLNIVYNGPTARPQDNLVINEIMYHPAVSNAHYVEILNNSATTSFDISQWKLSGLDYTFPDGTVLSNKQILLLVKDRAVFADTYGSAIPIFDQFNGNLDPEGEALKLIKPGKNPNDPDTLINAVRYENIAPWPTTADGEGPSLQLIDASQDDSRVSNWSDGSGWRFFSVTGVPGNPVTNNFTFNMDAAGDFYIDDISLVPGTVPGAGTSVLQNGDFETGALAPWTDLGNHASSAISTTIKHAGNAALHVVATGGGSVPLNTIVQSNIVTVPTSPYTLSFWFLPSTNANNLNYRLTSTFRTGFLTPTPISLKPSGASPGSVNTTAASIDPYPLLWINEVAPNNVTGITDNNGQHDPWLELYNSGTNIITLDGYALANNYTNLAQWPFPNGTTINPGEFKVIFADAQPGQSSGSELHTSFRLSGTNGAIVLSKAGVGGASRILDYINYAGLGPNFSYGSFPDGQVVDRQQFFYNTPGAPNNGAPVPVIINEWLASNTSGITNPANGHFDDWIELYNFGSVTIDLSGYWMSDNKGQKKNWQIPNGTTIGPGAFRLVWADNAASTNNNTDLHAGFALRAQGEDIGLYTPAGLTVDELSFGQQANNVSQGRYPDGNFGGVLYYMTTPTPRAANVIPVNQSSPTLPAIANKTVNERSSLIFTNLANDSDLPVQTLTYSLDVGAPLGASINAKTGVFRWTPTEAQGGAVYPMTIRVSDNGSPTFTDSKSFNVTVNKVNSPPDVPALEPRTLPENGTVNVSVTASDSDLPAQQLSFSLANAPAGAAIDPGTGAFSWTPNELQGPSTNNILVRVTDNGSPFLTTTQTLTIIVTEVNTAPQLVNPGTLTIDEMKGYTNFLVATDSDVPTNTLTFGLVAPFVSGVQLNSQSGRLNWTPNETNGGSSFVVSVRVFDNGSPSLSSTQSFTIMVNDVNSAPTLTNLNNSTRTINEFTSITLTNRGTDIDFPTNTLTYEIVSAPAGATVNPTNGLFTWTPTEAQGPSSNSILVRVIDDGTPSLSATQRFTIMVNESNSAPILSPISDKTVSSGQLLTFNSIVNDPDLPAQPLTFTLGAGAPSGINLDASTGVFTWTPSIGQAPSTNNLSITVSDNGTPSLSSTQTFTVFVTIGIRITDIHPTSATTLSITWESESGQTYHLEYRDDLDPGTSWQTLANSQVVANASTQSATITIGPNPSQRFYRVAKN